MEESAAYVQMHVLGQKHVRAHVMSTEVALAAVAHTLLPFLSRSSLPSMATRLNSS